MRSATSDSSKVKSKHRGYIHSSKERKLERLEALAFQSHCGECFDFVLTIYTYCIVPKTHKWVETPTDFFCPKRANIQFDKYHIWEMIN